MSDQGESWSTMPHSHAHRIAKNFVNPQVLMVAFLETFISCPVTFGVYRVALGENPTGLHDIPSGAVDASQRFVRFQPMPGIKRKILTK